MEFLDILTVGFLFLLYFSKKKKILWFYAYKEIRILSKQHKAKKNIKKFVTHYYDSPVPWYRMFGVVQAIIYIYILCIYFRCGEKTIITI